MEPRLAELLEQAERRVNVCAAFGLLWVATADGPADRKTQTYLDSCVESIPGGFDRVELLLPLIDSADSLTFLAICRQLQKELDPEEKAALLEMAVGTATANRKLGISANHILRFLADLLAISQDRLRALYRQYRGEDLPEPGDPGSIAWWEIREQGGRRDTRGKHGLMAKRFSRAEAYAILGLDREAPRAEIKRAYRRLVQNYHPDRFATLGPDAKEEAELKFLRVRQAYEVLSR